jgi:hypothetical protein
MTKETEAVLSFLICSIEFVRKSKLQDKCIVRSMRIMAGHTVSLNNRSMLEFPLLPHCAFFMAFIAKLIHLVQQERFIDRIMRRMTFYALSLKCRGMLLCIMADFILFFLMACKAEFFRFCLKAKFIFA